MFGLMSSDLIAWVVAITLGIVVVGLGLRRNLSDVTRSWLPRFGEAPELETGTPGLFDGGHGSRQLSPRQRRFAIGFYLLMSTCYVAFAVLSADSRLSHAALAALFAIAAVVIARREPRA
jgi:hypothetical protein